MQSVSLLWPRASAALPVWASLLLSLPASLPITRCSNIGRICALFSIRTALILPTFLPSQLFFFIVRELLVLLQLLVILPRCIIPLHVQLLNVDDEIAAVDHEVGILA
jgi:hypothetical protein